MSSRNLHIPVVILGSMNKTVVPIRGMHCRSCELMIEDELSQVPGVCKVEVSEKKATAEIYYDSEDLSLASVARAVKNAGYEIGLREPKPLFSKNIGDYADIFYALVVLFFLYQLVEITGLTKLINTGAGHPSSLVTVLLIGLTAGFSTCMALIGGIVLGVATKFAQSNSTATIRERFTPHLWFNAGRISSYAILGGVIGAVGSFFQISGFGLGLLTLAVALVMLTLGIQLTGLFPRLAGLKFTLPKGISQALGIKDQAAGEYSHKNAFMLGASTFFLPCGFTQAMQLFAMSSGSAVSGALIMGVFAIGTAPGLLGIGGITSLVRGVFAQKFFKFAGVVVVLLSLFNANNALNLLGWNPTAIVGSGTKVLAAADGAAVGRDGNVQVVRMTQNAGGYEPNAFTIVKNVPVRWVITSTDPNSCASSIISSKIGVRQNLHPGENIIEFTPKEAGTIPFSCMMGMFRGSFQVVEDDGSIENAVVPAALPTADSGDAQAAGGACGGGGCGCGGGAKNTEVVEAPKPQVAKGVQIIRAVYTNDTDISPNQFTVKSGSMVRLEIDAKDDGVGCMSSIMVSGITEPQLLEQGKTNVMEFTPASPGEYLITCAMGMPRGKIKVL